MSTLVSGTLVDPSGNIIPNAQIVLNAISTSFVVLSGAAVTQTSDANGAYSFALEVGNYSIYLAYGGKNYFYGAITITSTTTPASLNQLLNSAQMAAEISPDFLTYFQQQTGILLSNFSTLNSSVTTAVNAAGTATNQSGIAVNAANNAQTAYNGAIGLSRAYATMALAQAAITAGTIPNFGLFSTVSTDPSKTWLMWENVNGTPTAVIDPSTGAQKTYPSGAAVDALANDLGVISPLINSGDAPGILGRIKTALGKSLAQWRWDGTLITKLPLKAGKGVKITTGADQFLTIDTEVDTSQTVGGILGMIKTSLGKRLAMWRWDGTLITKLAIKAGAGVAITRDTDEFYRFDVNGINPTANAPGYLRGTQSPSGAIIEGVDPRGVPVGKVQLKTVAAYSTDGTISAWTSADPYGNIKLFTQDNTGVVRQTSLTDCSSVAISNGRVQCFGKYRGENNYWHILPDGTDIKRVFPVRAVCCMGDSLTASAGVSDARYQWPVLLAGLLGCATYQGGVGGSRSQEIAFRQGASVITCNVDGNTIPASGPVAVTIPSLNPFYPEVDGRTMRVFINEVDGVLTITNSALTFTRWVNGSAITVPANAPIRANVQGRDEWMHTLFTGRNDGANATVIMPFIASMVGNLKTITKRFVVIQILPTKNDINGSPSRAIVDDTNLQIRTAYPNFTLNLLAGLQAGNNGSAEDLSDVANGIMPRSLQSDDTHLNDAGYAIVANLVAAFFNSKNW